MSFAALRAIIGVDVFVGFAVVFDVGHHFSEDGFHVIVSLLVVLHGQHGVATSQLPQFAVQILVEDVVVGSHSGLVNRLTIFHQAGGGSDVIGIVDVVAAEDQFVKAILIEIFVAPAGSFGQQRFLIIPGSKAVFRFGPGLEDVPQQGGALRHGAVQPGSGGQLVGVGSAQVHITVFINASLVAETGDHGLVAHVFNAEQFQAVVDDGGHLSTGGGGAVDLLNVVEQGQAVFVVLLVPGVNFLGLGDVVRRPFAGQVVVVTNAAQGDGGDFLLGHVGFRSELAAADTDHQTVVVGAVDPAFSPVAFRNVGESGLLSSIVILVILLAEHKASDLGKFGAGQVIVRTISAAPAGVAFEDAQSSQPIDIDRILGRRLGVVIVRDLLVGCHSSGSDREDHSQRQKND